MVKIEGVIVPTIFAHMISNSTLVFVSVKELGVVDMVVMCLVKVNIKG